VAMQMLHYNNSTGASSSNGNANTPLFFSSGTNGGAFAFGQSQSSSKSGGESAAGR
jgi:hypothetical protein